MDKAQFVAWAKALPDDVEIVPVERRVALVNRDGSPYTAPPTRFVKSVHQACEVRVDMSFEVRLVSTEKGVYNRYATNPIRWRRVRWLSEADLPI